MMNVKMNFFPLNWLILFILMWDYVLKDIVKKKDTNMHICDNRLTPITWQDLSLISQNSVTLSGV